MRRPDFFLVGAPKCGTTAMNDYLAEHPDVFMAPKEPHFFGLHKLTEDAYLRLFAAATNEKRVGEASVLYLASPTAPNEIAAFAPDAQIIVMLRNPIEVIEALHAELLFQRIEPIADLRQALDAEDLRRIGTPLDETAAWLYREQVTFDEQLERYFAKFGRERVHVIIYDDFRGDNLGEYHKVLQFLGLNAFTPRLRVVNARKRPRSRAAHALITRRPDWVRSVIRRALPDPWRRRAWKTAMRLNAQRIEPRFDFALRARLAEDTEPIIERLERLLRRDLSTWRISSGEM